MSENTLSPHVVLVGDVPIHFEPGADQFAGCDDLEVRGPFFSQHEAQEYAMHLDRYVALVVPLKPSDEPDAMYHGKPSGEPQDRYSVLYVQRSNAYMVIDSQTGDNAALTNRSIPLTFGSLANAEATRDGLNAEATS